MQENEYESESQEDLTNLEKAEPCEMPETTYTKMGESPTPINVIDNRVKNEPKITENKW